MRSIDLANGEVGPLVGHFSGKDELRPGARVAFESALREKSRKRIGAGGELNNPVLDAGRFERRNRIIDCFRTRGGVDAQSLYAAKHDVVENARHRPDAVVDAPMLQAELLRNAVGCRRVEVRRRVALHTLECGDVIQRNGRRKARVGHAGGDPEAIVDTIMTLSLNGHAIDYVEQGAGPCIVLVPGSLSTTAAWRPVADQLKDRFRTVATSLMGYGGTEEIRTAENCTVDPQAEAVEAVIARAGGAVHLVGHSWGGTVALSVALRRKVPLASLVLFEANPCDVLRQSGDIATYDVVHEMWADYAEAFAAGERDAVRRVVDLWEGEGSFDRIPPRVREYMLQTTPANLRDWAAHWAFRAPLADYAALKLPALVAHGADTHFAMKRVAAILAAQMPNSKLAQIAGARHFLISSHSRESADLIASHVSAVEGSAVR